MHKLMTPLFRFLSIFFVFTCIIVFPTIAETSPIDFTFTPTIGVYTGTVRELFFESDKTVQSQLDWQEYAVPYIEASETITAYNAFFTVSLLSAIPLYCGIMEDYDWLADDYVNRSSDTLSFYSKHELYLDKRFDISAQAGYNFPLRQYIISPGIEITYRSQKFSGYNGYKQYDEVDYTWDEDIEKEEFSGNVISYEQSLLLPSVTFDIEMALNPLLSLKVQTAYYPYLFISALDSHYVKEAQYYDQMYGGYGFVTGGSIIYKNIAFNVSYEYLKDYYGITSSSIIGTTDSNFIIDDDFYSGTDSSLFSFSITYNY